jgi:hypothetical protein
MKQTPKEIKSLENFEPGKISKDGFLGKDRRHLHDIIRADQLSLSRLNVTTEQIAARLQYFIDKGKCAFETEIEFGEFSVRVKWSRGMLPCPFGEQGLHHKIVATVYNKSLREEIEYSQLSVHLIRAHGFFEGEESAFRLNPEELIKVLNITTHQ